MINVAVVGATGAVGREILRELEPVEGVNVVPFASPRSAGTMLNFRDSTLKVLAFNLEQVVRCDYVLMSAGGAFSKEVGREIAEKTILIDNSSAWRMESRVPLVVPEVNGDRLEGFEKGIIANPNCSTIQMVVALKPLKDAYGLRQVQVATYQSVSGAGQKGIDELGDQVAQKFKFQEQIPQKFAKPIAFNVLPAIDVLDPSFHAFEEIKMINETRKILSMERLEVMATTVRVPVFNCHGEAVTVRLGEEITLQQAQDVFRDAEGIKFYPENDHSMFPTPLDVEGDGQVHVARVRLPYGSEKSDYVQFWNIADNLKKGAATNAVQIMELHRQKNS